MVSTADIQRSLDGKEIGSEGFYLTPSGKVVHLKTCGFGGGFEYSKDFEHYTFLSDEKCSEILGKIADPKQAISMLEKAI